MKLKKVCSVLLIAGMLTGLLAGCGGVSEPDTNGPSGNDTQEENGDGKETGDGNTAEGEPTEITVVLRTLGTVEESASAAVEEAVNEITLAEINVAVDLQWIDSAQYGTQVPMMITGNEQMDLMMYTPNSSTTYSTLMAQNQLLDITDYLNEYAPAVKETLGDELLQATSRDGRVYGVGNYGPLAFQQMIAIRKDYLDQVGMTEKAQNLKTWTELEEVLQAVADATGEGLVNSDINGTVIMSNPCINAADAFADGYVYDNIGDSANLFMADVETGKVECLYFNEDIKTVMKRTYDWYQKGLIYKDAATAQDFGATLLKNGVGCGLVTTTEVGGETATVSSAGHEMVVIHPIEESMITTGNLTKFGFCVPVTATEPEAAIKFLNLLYESDTLSTMLSWGIEGRDYIVKEDGTADYPEGVTADTVQYHIADFLYGNRLKVVPWTGAEENLREVQQQFNEATPVSPFLGFNVSNEGLESTLTACTNVFEKYKNTILSGSCTGDFEEYYQQFLDELTAAGVNDLIAEYQEQLDTWIAANK